MRVLWKNDGRRNGSIYGWLNGVNGVITKVYQNNYKYYLFLYWCIYIEYNQVAKCRGTSVLLKQSSTLYNIPLFILKVFWWRNIVLLLFGRYDTQYIIPQININTWYI